MNYLKHSKVAFLLFFGSLVLSCGNDSLELQEGDLLF